MPTLAGGGGWRGGAGGGECEHGTRHSEGETVGVHNSAQLCTRRGRDPRPCPLPRPSLRAREGMWLAALGEGVSGPCAWGLYLRAGWCAAVMRNRGESPFLGGNLSFFRLDPLRF